MCYLYTFALCIIARNIRNKRQFFVCTKRNLPHLTCRPGFRSAFKLRPQRVHRYSRDAAFLGSHGLSIRGMLPICQSYERLMGHRRSHKLNAGKYMYVRNLKKIMLHRIKNTEKKCI